MTERESEAIQREIDRTRADLDETLTAVQEKFTPQRWLDDGIQWLKGEGGGDYLRGLASIARQHPVPVAMIVVGAAWLYLALSKGDRRVEAEIGRDRPLPEPAPLPRAAAAPPASAPTYEPRPDLAAAAPGP